ncbi:MAG: rod shape-determining protein RodA [Patescibacteria group bacterium]|nr:rod shape-determining protein RodA [Patescibacteria group bacterium]
MSKKFFFGIDWYLILPVVVLVLISLVTLFSLNISLFKSQLIFLIVSVFAFIFFSEVNYKIIKIYATPIYIVSLVIFVLIFFLGIESRGAIRWIDIFGFRLQFSEILKPFLAISFASYLTEKKQYNFRSLIDVLILLAPIVLLIFFQPDLGTALLYAGTVFTTLIYAGFSLKYFAGLFLPFLASVPIFWDFLRDYQKQRVLTFIDPASDPLGTSYNVIQSVIAVGSGMITGKGLGQGTQSGLRFLPERHTDFIFASISEQLGFIGAVIILLAFAFFLYKIYSIFANVDDKFAGVFSAIVFFSFLIQIFVNIGMNIGMVPVVGVTLPFVSYGGSSLLSSFIFLGFLSSINKASKINGVLEIR